MEKRVLLNMNNVFKKEHKTSYFSQFYFVKETGVPGEKH
jgi:hypothetical protein